MSNPAKGSFTLKFEVKVTIAESGSSLANPVASNGDEPSTSGAISNRHANGYRSHDFQIVNRNSEVFESGLVSSLPVVALIKERVVIHRSELTTINNFDNASPITLLRVYEHNHARADSADPGDWTLISEPGEEPKLFVKTPPAPIIGAL